MSQTVHIVFLFQVYRIPHFQLGAELSQDSKLSRRFDGVCHYDLYLKPHHASSPLCSKLCWDCRRSPWPSPRPSAPSPPHFLCLSIEGYLLRVIPCLIHRVVYWDYLDCICFWSHSDAYGSRTSFVLDVEALWLLEWPRGSPAGPCAMRALASPSFKSSLISTLFAALPRTAVVIPFRIGREQELSLSINNIALRSSGNTPLSTSFGSPPALLPPTFTLR